MAPHGLSDPQAQGSWRGMGPACGPTSISGRAGVAKLRAFAYPNCQVPNKASAPAHAKRRRPEWYTWTVVNDGSNLPRGRVENSRKSCLRHTRSQGSKGEYTCSRGLLAQGLWPRGPDFMADEPITVQFGTIVDLSRLCVAASTTGDHGLAVST